VNRFQSVPGACANGSTSNARSEPIKVVCEWTCYYNANQYIARARATADPTTKLRGTVARSLEPAGGVGEGGGVGVDGGGAGDGAGGGAGDGVPQVEESSTVKLKTGRLSHVL
jgi:hypothetical protein